MLMLVCKKLEEVIYATATMVVNAFLVFVNLLQRQEEHLHHADLGPEPPFPTRGSSSLPRCGCGCGDVCA